MNKELLNLEIGRKKIPDDEIMLLSSQYQIILKSGLQVTRATKLFLRQTENKRLKTILQKVLRDVDSGCALSDSFEKHATGQIPRTFFETIRAGEHLGNLSRSFESLRDYYKKQSAISKQIKSALIYPIFVLVVAVVVLIVIMAYVMPQMISVFDNMGGNLPLITRALIKISGFFSENLLIILLVPCALFLALKAYGKSDEGRYKLDKLKLKIPVFGKINMLNNCAMFSNTLAMLIGSGIVLSKSLRILSGVFENDVFKKACERLSKDVNSGRSLMQGMRKEECFPGTLTEMIGIGEETGELEQILETTGEYYQFEAESATKNMISKIEPMMLVFVAVLAGFIVFAIYIPLFQMYDLF